MRTETIAQSRVQESAADRAGRDETRAFFEAAARMRGKVPGLEDMTGRLAVEVGGQTVGAVEVDHGVVSFFLGEPEGTPAAVVVCVDVDDSVRLLKGQLNPFVVAIQGRGFVRGDTVFALEVISSLRAYSPFAAPRAKGAAS